MTEFDPTEGSPPSGSSAVGAGALRREIRALVRRGRRDRALTQTELGKAVSVSRFTVNRIEMGSLDLSPSLAEQIQGVLGLPTLTLLVSQRDQLAAITRNERDLVARRLLATPSLERLRIALADDLDVYRIIFDALSVGGFVASDDVQVIFPSVRRERELFGGSPLLGHFQYQIKRLTDLQGSDAYPTNGLRLFESSSVLGSCIIASTRTGTECAYWPAVPVAGVVSGNALPVATTLDLSVTAQLEAHLDSLILGRDPLRVNEALCTVSAPDAASREEGGRPLFTRYFTVGVDQEEDVDDAEGFALALVLPISLCSRKHYGIARRVIAYKRPSAVEDRQRLSLFSNTVDDADMRAARSSDEGTVDVDTARSTRRALAAALEINDYLVGNAGVVPDFAYKVAVQREFAMFGLNIDLARFTPVPLPVELRLVSKSGHGRPRGALAPRLFTVELNTGDGEPELALLQSIADVEELGVTDLVESSRLNDFLLAARDCGFLEPLLRQLTVADR